MHMQKYIMFFLIVVSINNYTMEDRVEVVMENFHQIIEERINFFKAQSESSEFFKNFDAIKLYKSCSEKQGPKLKEFFLLINPKMNGCFLENAEPSSDTEFVYFLKFFHLLNQANKKFEIKEQLILDMCNSKLDIDLDEKQKQYVLDKDQLNPDTVYIYSASLKLNSCFCIYTKLQEDHKKRISYYYLQIPGIDGVLTKNYGTNILDVNNK